MHPFEEADSLNSGELDGEFIPKQTEDWAEDLEKAEDAEVNGSVWKVQTQEENDKIETSLYSAEGVSDQVSLNPS